jgi:hypothetical protein
MTRAPIGADGDSTPNEFPTQLQSVVVFRGGAQLVCRFTDIAASACQTCG